MSSFDAYEREDGTIDWDAYHAAQVASGDKCQTCGCFMMNIRLFGPKREPGPQDCADCKDMSGNDDEVTHDKYVRCPKCKHKWDPFECEDYHLAADGEHEAWCGECDHKFEVSTHVRYSFESPAIIKEESDCADKDS